MNKQFAELQVYAIGGGIAFGLPTTTTPFLALPSGQATIKPWGNSGFLFENIVTGDVIAFVNEYDDVLDSADAPYGVDQASVFTALAAFFFDVAGGGSQRNSCRLCYGKRHQEGDPHVQYEDQRFITAEGMVVWTRDYACCHGKYGALLEASVQCS
jgi:hypothetical protein